MNRVTNHVLVWVSFDFSKSLTKWEEETDSGIYIYSAVMRGEKNVKHLRAFEPIKNVVLSVYCIIAT